MKYGVLAKIPVTGDLKENCENIGVDAKEINEKRAQAKEAKMIADAKAFLESCEEKDA